MTGNASELQTLLDQATQYAAQQDLARAEESYRAALQRDPANTRALLSLGELLHVSRRFKDAINYFERAADHQPDTVQPWIMLGRSLNNLRRFVAAENAFRQAASLSPENATIHNYIGHALRAQGKIGDACLEFERASILDPDLTPAIQNLGLAFLSLDKPEEARSAFEKAIASDAGNARLHIHHGASLHHLGRYGEAAAAYRRALDIEPDSAEALNNLGVSLQEDGHLEQAVISYRKASALAPDDKQIQVKICDALLSLGRADEALALADQVLDQRPGQTGALAVRTVALTETGADQEAAELLDFDLLVRQVRLQPPDSFVSLKAFNQALANHVSNHPTLTFEPPGHATRGGSHTGELLVDPKGPTAQLEAVIHDAVTDWCMVLAGETGSDVAAMLLDSRPADWKLTMWAVIMQSQGFQLPHMHPAAWLSGVYYPQLPSSLNDTDQAGWIEFGRPPETLQPKKKHTARIYKPEEGLLLLFPSYMYHLTIPFDSDEKRISIAFDVIPDF